MGYVLTSVLVLECFVIFCLNGKNIVSPSFIACAVFAFSAAIYAFNGEYYQYEISFNTVAVIALLLFCMFLGELTVNLTAKGKKYVNLKTEKPLVLPVYVCVILHSFVLIVGVAYFYSVYRFSLKVGNTSGNFLTMAMYVRESGEYQKGVLISQGTVISECILYFFVYSFFLNKAILKKSFVRYLWVILAYIPHILAADNRTNLLRAIIVSVIIIFFMLKQRSMWQRKYDRRIIIIAAFAVAAFMLLFRLLGYRTGTSERNELWANLIKYSSSGIVGLDKFLNGEMVFGYVIFGERTFQNIYLLLRERGFTSIPEIAHFDAFFSCGTGASNIYTGLKGYIQDFGLFGAAIAMILVGMVMSVILNSLKYHKVSYIKVNVFALFFYPVAMMSIDNCTADILSVTTVYMVIYMYVIKLLAGLFRDKKYDRRLYSYAFS